MSDAATRSGAPVTTERWLQVLPQAFHHAEAFIEGNASALRALAEVLIAAADSNGAQLDEVFASDGEGYSILIRRHERPADFRPPFYISEAECENWTAGRCTLAQQMAGMSGPSHPREAELAAALSTSSAIAAILLAVSADNIPPELRIKVASAVEDAAKEAAAVIQKYAVLARNRERST